MGDRRRVQIGSGVSTTIEIELLGGVFTLVPLTKSVLKITDPLESKVDEAESGDDLVAAVGALFDARLTAVNGAGKPSTLIKKSWNADELEITELRSMYVELLSAGAPPT